MNRHELGEGGDGIANKKKRESHLRFTRFLPRPHTPFHFSWICAACSFFNLTESTFAKNVQVVSQPRLQVNRVIRIYGAPLLHHSPNGEVPVYPDMIGGYELLSLSLFFCICVFFSLHLSYFLWVMFKLSAVSVDVVVSVSRHVSLRKGKTWTAC